MVMAELAAVAKIAATQYGVVSRAQAMGTGLSQDSIDRLMAEGWSRPHNGVYSLWLPRLRADRWKHDLFAAALWLGESSGVSHRAASALWELDGQATREREFTTTSRRRAPGLTIHRAIRFVPGDLRTVAGMRVTSPERTLIDLGAVATAEVVELAFESAIRKRLTTPARVAERLQLGGLLRGTAMMRALLAQRRARTETALETMLWQLLKRSGLPLPRPQYVVRGLRGEFIGRVDFAYPEHKIAIEADGYEFHSTRRDWQRDRTRQNAIVMLGWTFLRVTWEDVQGRRPEIIADLRLLLTQTPRAPRNLGQNPLARSRG